MKVRRDNCRELAMANPFCCVGSVSFACRVTEPEPVASISRESIAGHKHKSCRSSGRWLRGDAILPARCYITRIERLRRSGEFSTLQPCCRIGDTVRSEDRIGRANADRRISDRQDTRSRFSAVQHAVRMADQRAVVDARERTVLGAIVHVSGTGPLQPAVGRRTPSTS